MFKIDIHTHILPPELPDLKAKFGYDGLIQMRPCTDCSDVDLLDSSGKVFRRVKQNCIDPQARLKEMDAQGLHVQVLSTVPVLFSYRARPEVGTFISRLLNDQLATVVMQNPKRFIGIGTVPLQDPAAACEEAKRCVRELGFPGFQIGSHVNAWNLSDPALFPFYETCERLGAALFVHPWEMMGEERMPQYWLPWLVGMPAETALAISSMIFGGVFEKFPKLRVAFAHGGGAYPFIAGRVQHGFDARPDLCAVDCKLPPKDFLGRFYVDSLVHDTDGLHRIVQLFGKDKVCLGTDYPFPLGEGRAGEGIENAKFSPADQEWLYHRSALEWLGLKKERFL